MMVKVKYLKYKLVPILWKALECAYLMVGELLKIMERPSLVKLGTDIIDDVASGGSQRSMNTIKFMDMFMDDDGFNSNDVMFLATKFLALEMVKLNCKVVEKDDEDYLDISVWVNHECVTIANPKSVTAEPVDRLTLFWTKQYNPTGPTHYLVVRATYWYANSCLDDDGFDGDMPVGFNEVEESVFTYDGSSEEGIAKLISAGFIYVKV